MNRIKMTKNFAISMLIAFAVASNLKAQCPTYEDEASQDIIGSFVSTPHWDKIKADNGLSGVTAADIEKLNLPSHQNICSTLNTKANHMFSKYHVYYYKLKNRYIVVSVLKQPEDPDLVTVGLSFLDIFDSNLNPLNGYSF